MEHRFVKISYTGRIKEGSVFDTTDKETAEKEKIFDDKRIYRPVPIVVGEKQVLPGLDDVLKDLKVGEEKQVELPPEKAYGQKDPNLIRLIPMKAFKQQKMQPMPGMIIELDGRPARIQTVSGGRVRVDFNGELAGKTLDYKIKIEEEAKIQDQRLKFLVERSFNTTEGFEVRKIGRAHV
jgi:FKBP-type peptidyl-prolyl cis-trans isomerase 2